MSSDETNGFLSLHVENTSSRTSNRNEELTQGSENIIVPIVFSVIVVLGGIGNLLVMIVIHFIFLIFCVRFHAVVYPTLLAYWSVYVQVCTLGTTCFCGGKYFDTCSNVF